MVRVLIFISCVGIVQGLFGQQLPSKWRDFLESPAINSNYFLIHSKNFLTEDILIRRLDKDFLIVRSVNEFLHSNRAAHPINNSWKLNINSRAPGHQSYYVRTIEPFDWKEFPDVSLISNYCNIYLIKCSYRQVLALAEHPSITHVSDESAYPEVESRVIDLNLNPNRVNKVHRYFPALNGSTQTVSIQENQYDVSDIDLINRNIPTELSAEIVDNHATEMATIIAGAGNSFITGKGVAQKARITSSDFLDVLPDQDAEYIQLAINTQNHSYGTKIESFYGAQAAAFDQSSFNNIHLLHVFSSGNLGNEASTDGVYENLPGHANLTGNFKMAKNALVVGSVDTVGNEIAFVSRGPAYDGRIKPEVTAYSVVGSSNSAALVSGVSVLLQEYHESTYGQKMPSALTKAVLINGATDVGAPGIDHITGYGNVDAFKSLEILQNNWFINDSVEEGETKQFNLSVPSNAVNLKISICWTDVPSEIGNPKALVNDLDLKLTSTSSAEEWLPWTLSTTASAVELGLPPTRAIDRLNNVEQVTLPNPEKTDYIIEVHGYEVINSQSFHIAYHYDLEEVLKWDFPTANDNMPYNGETGSYFRWKSTLSETFGSLEYSLDGGSNWLVLSDNLDLTKGHWRWANPPEVHAEAIARISAGSKMFATEPFTISRPPKVSVGFVCGDSLRLQWKSITGAAGYDVYSPGVENLELFQTTNDTAIIINDINELEDHRFSIIPILGNSKEAIGSQTLDFTQQASCFLLSFFQEVNLDSGIYLHVRLGTTYGVKKVSFQRKVSSRFADVEVIEFPLNSDIRVLDKDPVQGNNIHRVVIDFINGQSLVEEATGSFYLTQVPTLAYPNPAPHPSNVNVITKELTSSNPRLRIFNSQGIEVSNVPIFGSQVTISTLELSSGIYLFWVIDGSERYAGRLVVR